MAELPSVPLSPTRFLEVGFPEALAAARAPAGAKEVGARGTRREPWGGLP